MNKNKIIYKIVVEDINSISEELINRKLTNDELKEVEKRLGNYINWYDAIENTFLDWGIELNEKDD